MALTKAELYQKHKLRYHTDPAYRAHILSQKSQYMKKRRIEDPAHKERLNEYNRKNSKYFCMKAKEYNQKQPFHYAYKRLKLRAKQNNLPFDLNKEYLESIWTGKCAIFNTPIQLPYSTRHQAPDKATVDRIIPNKGYIQGNICWVSNKANIIKSFGTLEDHEAIVKYIKSHAVDLILTI